MKRSLIKENIKKNKGITIVALVITIIIIIIIAGISIVQIKNIQIFEKVQLAKEKTQEEQQLENDILSSYTDEINTYIGNSRNNNEKFYCLVATTPTYAGGSLEYDLPSGYTSENCMIVGYQCTCTDGFIYANYVNANNVIVSMKENNSSNKLRIVINHNQFANKTIKILLYKINDF